MEDIVILLIIAFVYVRTFIIAVLIALAGFLIFYGTLLLIEHIKEKHDDK